MDNSRDPVIHVFYRPEQVLAVDSPENFSKSPQKPRLLLEFLSRHSLDRHFVRHDAWPPFQWEDFLLAHTPEYVDAFFAGRPPLCTSNGLAWSAQFAGVRAVWMASQGQIKVYADDGAVLRVVDLGELRQTKAA